MPHHKPWSPRRSFSAKLRQQDVARWEELARQGYAVQLGRLSKKERQEMRRAQAHAKRLPGTQKHDGYTCECCDDLLRCHYRWQRLWEGMLFVLKTQEAHAYDRLVKKLERHDIFGTSTPFTIVGTRHVAREVSGPAGDAYDTVPGDRMLEAAQAFAEDRNRVSLRARTRPRSPSVLMATAQHGLELTLREQGHRAPATEAWRRVAEKFGYADLESARTIGSRIPAGWRKSIFDKRPGWQRYTQSMAEIIMKSDVPMARRGRKA